jgi:hypothetical protein
MQPLWLWLWSGEHVSDRGDIWIQLNAGTLTPWTGTTYARIRGTTSRTTMSGYMQLDDDQGLARRTVRRRPTNTYHTSIDDYYSTGVSSHKVTTRTFTYKTFNKSSPAYTSETFEYDRSGGSFALLHTQEHHNFYLHLFSIWYLVVRVILRSTFL